MRSSSQRLDDRWTSTTRHLVSSAAAQPPGPLELELLVFLGTSSGVLWLSLPLLLLHEDAERRWTKSRDSSTRPPLITPSPLINPLASSVISQEAQCYISNVIAARTIQRENDKHTHTLMYAYIYFCCINTTYLFIEVPVAMKVFSFHLNSMNI